MCGMMMSRWTAWHVQVRCLVDVPGDKLPSASTGALQAHLENVVAPQVLTLTLATTKFHAGCSVHTT